jgi:SAM-dependent methyltransferase
MKSQDSVQYYQHHAQRIALNAKKVKDPKELHPFLDMLDANARIIDLGCGSGLDLSFMTRAGFQGVGVEGAGALVEIARLQNPGTEILEKNLLFLTLKESEFDGVWANRSLHHFEPEAAQRVIATAFRGLKSGGVLGVVIYEGSLAYQDREGDLSGPSRLIHPFTENAISSMIEQTGFKIKKVGRQSANPDLGHPLPSLLILANKI